MISQQTALNLLTAHYDGSHPLDSSTVDTLNNIAYPSNSSMGDGGTGNAPNSSMGDQPNSGNTPGNAPAESAGSGGTGNAPAVIPNSPQGQGGTINEPTPGQGEPLPAAIDNAPLTPHDNGISNPEPIKQQPIETPAVEAPKPIETKPVIGTVSNPISAAEKKWYETNYGSPAEEAKPNFSPTANAQLKVLDSKLNSFDEIIGRIQNDQSMSVQTKAALLTEVNARRQAVVDQRKSIIDTATESGSPGKPETKGIVGDIESGIKKETAMNVKEAEDVTNEQAANNKALADNETAESAARNLRMQKTQSYVDSLNKDAAALANYQENPDRWWNSKSSYEQVGLSIAGALGAWAGTKSGHNMAAEQINKNIDRDIEAQRNSYNAKKASFDAKKSLYAANMEQYKNPEAALAATKVMLTDQSARRIQDIKNKNASPRVQQAGDLALLQLQKNRADAEKAFATQMYMLQHPAGAGGGTVKQEVVDDVANGFKVVESYTNAANDIANLAAKGDVNLNPSGLRKAAASTASLVTGDQTADNFKYGEGGNAVRKRVQQVVVENPVVGEHSDADRENAIDVIIGDGNPNGIVKRLLARGQTAAREVQRKTQGLSPKDQTTLSNRVLPPQTQAPLPPPAARQR